MIDYGKKNLLGVQINCVDYEASVQQIVQAAKARRPFGVSALAVHGVMTGVLDREHCHRLNELELIVPDGQPVRWALNALHRLDLPDRVYGPNLTLKVCEAAAAEGLPIFLFGGRASTLQKLADRLRALYPGLKIAGMAESRFRTLDADERDALVDQIKASGAAITLAGIGCPRQEVWAYEFKGRLSMPILAVGAAFAFHAGELSQAPAWMQGAGLEWLYRFTREPRRLWQRYVLLNPAYVGLVALQWSRLLTLTPERGKVPEHEILYG